MSDFKDTLERIERRVAMPEPAMERMFRRRERRQRNERIVAAAVGLGVFAAGAVGAVLTLRVAGGTQPASGGGRAAASESGGLVLPTVAIWTAIAVLTLTAFAAARLRARFGHADVDVEKEGREPDGAAASARRTAAAPGAAPLEGGTEMDSRPTMQVGFPPAEMPGISFDEGRVRRTNRWLTGAVIVLAVAVVALGVALIVQAGSGETASPGAKPPAQPAASDPTVRLIDRLDAAVSRRDGAAAAALFSPDGFIQAGNGVVVYQGRAAIERRISHLPPFTAERTGPPMIYGALAVAFYEVSYPSGSDSTLARTFVFRNGEIYSVTDVQYETQPA